MRHAAICFVLLFSACTSSSGPDAEPQPVARSADKAPAATSAKAAEGAKSAEANRPPSGTPAASVWQQAELVSSFREDNPKLPPPGSLRAGRLPRVAPKLERKAIPARLTLSKVEVENTRWDKDSGYGYWYLAFEAGALETAPASTLLIRYVGVGGALEGCELVSLPAFSAKGLSMIGFRSRGPKGEVPLERVVVEGVSAETTLPDPAEEVSFAPGSAIELVSYELVPVDEPSPGYRLVCVLRNKGPDCDLLLTSNWQWRPGSKSRTAGSDRAISAFTSGSQRTLEFVGQSEAEVWRVRLAVKAARNPRAPR